MTECPHCGCEYFKEEFVYFKDQTKHLKITCASCLQFIKWKKHDESGKTKEDYRREHYEKMHWNYKPRPSSGIKRKLAYSQRRCLPKK